jgi:hypothetical protein
MAADPIVELAEAVVLSLNEGHFAMQFVAERAYDPLAELEALRSLKVLVAPRAEETTPDSRESLEELVQIDVAIAAKLDGDPEQPADRDACDALAGLASEIKEHLFETGALANCAWQSCQRSVLWDPERLRKSHVFVALQTHTYRRSRFAN